MKVVAKMKVNSITQTGDAKKPCVQVQLGAVYSNDPESENRSFASATPTASVNMTIDAGRPAAQAFHLAEEFFVTFESAGVPDRKYLTDGMPPDECDIVISNREGNAEQRAHFKPNILSAVIANEKIEASWGFEKFISLGYTHWRYLRDGE